MAIEFWLESLQRVDDPAEFPQITLTRASDGTSYTGPGSVVRKASGELAMKCYSKADFRESLNRRPDAPGVLIPPSNLFEMDALDMHGHRWRCDRISDDPHYSLPTDMAVVTANPYRLVGERPRTASGESYLGIGICTDAKFPINQKEQTERKVGEKLVSANYSWAAAEFDGDGLRFRIMRDDALLIVQVYGEWPAGEAEELADWVVKSLQFTLGRRLIADVITLSAGESRQQIIQGVARDRLRPRIEPPRQWVSRPDEGSTWQIFVQFLRFLRTADRPKAKELCRWTAEVVDSGAAPIEVSSLVLSVAVEGIIGLMQGKESVDDALLKDVNVALRAAEGADFPASLKPRILGAINSMKRPRAADYLKDLTRRGVIPGGYVDAWNSLRNWSTHADAAVEDWVEPILSKSWIVLALYYRLVLILIGYRGTYTDYGQSGWPERTL